MMTFLIPDQGQVTDPPPSKWTGRPRELSLDNTSHQLESQSENHIPINNKFSINAFPCVQSPILVFTDPRFQKSLTSIASWAFQNI